MKNVTLPINIISLLLINLFGVGVSPNIKCAPDENYRTTKHTTTKQ